MRESAQSWRELLIDIRQRGLEITPDLAVGDGALGFWKAIEEVFPGTRHQRCWVHKTANVLNKVALSVQVNMKADLREIYGAPTRAAAEAAIDVFADKYVALAFMAAIEDVGRFRRMRDIGVYLGLMPKRYRSAFERSIPTEQGGIAIAITIEGDDSRDVPVRPNRGDKRKLAILLPVVSERASIDPQQSGALSCKRGDHFSCVSSRGQPCVLRSGSAWQRRH